MKGSLPKAKEMGTVHIYEGNIQLTTNEPK
jgi:hypothetical protein